jgi:phosphopantetheinyl transferase (holo-ACP synthase)
LLLGNDVVDLREALPLAKERDERFLARVFTALERDCIANSLHPPLTLWLLWSAKESLFKVVSKLVPGTVFAHSQFSLRRKSLAELYFAEPSGGSLSLSTMHSHYRIELGWEWNREFVHCGASWGDPSRGFERHVALGAEVPNGPLSAREEESVHSSESRKVRLLAKSCLKPGFEIVRAQSLPPVILRDGKPAPGMDLSLSHDGRFVAALVGK